MGGQPDRAGYGLDAPGVVVGNVIAGIAALGGASIAWAVLRRRHPVPAVLIGGWWGLGAVIQAGLMVRSSRVVRRPRAAPTNVRRK